MWENLPGFVYDKLCQVLAVAGQMKLQLALKLDQVRYDVLFQSGREAGKTVKKKSPVNIFVIFSFLFILLLPFAIGWAGPSLYCLCCDDHIRCEVVYREDLRYCP